MLPLTRLRATHILVACHQQTTTIMRNIQEGRMTCSPDVINVSLHSLLELYRHLPDHNYPFKVCDTPRTRSMGHDFMTSPLCRTAAFSMYASSNPEGFLLFAEVGLLLTEISGWLAGSLQSGQGMLSHEQRVSFSLSLLFAPAVLFVVCKTNAHAWPIKSHVDVVWPLDFFCPSLS